MSHWEFEGKSDDWFTPGYVFEAMELFFDLDVAGNDLAQVPAKKILTRNGLEEEWNGMVWMNPPFGGRNGLVPWLDKFFDHAFGVCLVPDRTSAPWFQDAARRADGILFVSGKIKFIKPDGSIGKSPSTGTALMAIGGEPMKALRSAQDKGLGILLVR